MSVWPDHAQVLCTYHTKRALLPRLYAWQGRPEDIPDDSEFRHYAELRRPEVIMQLLIFKLHCPCVSLDT